MARREMRTAVGRLTESAVLLAAAMLLNFITLARLPFGGAVTACSGLPLIVVAYRHGARQGCLTALAYSFLQLLLGLDALSYATSAVAVVAVVALDYVLPFTALGLGGVFRRAASTQAGALAAGAALVGVLQYGCHCVAGFTVWRGISVPVAQAVWYSLGYNATYQLPETVITVIGAVYVSQLLDLGRGRPSRTVRAADRRARWLTGIAVTVWAAVGVWVTVVVCRELQTEAGFDITRLAAVPWSKVGWLTGGGLLAGGGCWIASRKVS